MPDPAAAPVEISFCILSYNTCEVLRDCLDSLAACPPDCPYEVIVVDNGSRDGTLEMLRGRFPDVQVIANATNQGYTAPMNQALRAARASRYLVQLNPDTLVQPGAFTTLRAYLDVHPRVGIATPKVLNRDGSLQAQCRRSAAGPWDAFCYITGLGRLFLRSRRFNGYLMGYYGENVTHPVQAVSGSCMFIRRDVVEQIGYLDERFFAWQEDSDFCLRAGEDGWQVMYVPTARIIHFGGQGGSTVEQERAVRAWHASYWLYYQKHFASRHSVIFNALFHLLIQLKLSLALLGTRLRLRGYIGSAKP